MDTSTGRFISQDSYAGSTADPVSLHKYLYANSNPVMYSDPSGYYSLGEVVGCMAISGVICGISSGCINMFRFLWDKDYNGNATNWLEAFSEGYWPGVIAGITFGGWAYLATHLVLVGILVSLFSGCSAWQFSTSASEKYTNGNTGGAAIDFTLACVSAWSMFYFGYSSFTKISAWASTKITTATNSNNAKVDVRKFSEYIFKENATHGKNTVFENLGYSKNESAQLVKIYEQQAMQKYANGNYTLGVKDSYGQRINIEIELYGIGESSGEVSYIKSGWMINSDGTISLNTPFSGFTR